MKFNTINIILAFTNITSIFPIYVCLLYEDYLTAFLVSMAALFSFLSHLIENHKHGGTGIIIDNVDIISRKTSFILNRFDGFFASLTFLRFVYLIFYYKIKLIELFAALIAILSLFISEYDKSKDTRLRYLLFHSSWHVCIFILTGIGYTSMMELGKR